MRALILIVATACATHGAKKMEPVKCTSLAECRTHEGKRVEIVGVYQIWDPRPVHHQDSPPAQQVVLKLGDEEGPYLGAWGHDDHMRPLGEIGRLQGKTVRVIGTFRSHMPPVGDPRAASVDGPCIHPIETITAE